jgi:hypothetical protein
MIMDEFEQKRSGQGPVGGARSAARNPVPGFQPRRGLVGRMLTLPPSASGSPPPFPPPIPPRRDGRGVIRFPALPRAAARPATAGRALPWAGMFRPYRAEECRVARG